MCQSGSWPNPLDKPALTCQTTVIPKKETMTFLEFLDTVTDENDTISWRQAVLIAGNHGLTKEFGIEYVNLAGDRVDAGEFACWLGY